MATIEDLDKTSVSEMSTEELQNMLLEIRKSRRTPPKKAKKKAAAKTPKINVDSMTPEAAAELLKKLEGLV